MKTKKKITNEQILLKGILKKERIATSPDMAESTFFEQFTNEQILKNYDLSYEEIESGMTGGGDDGGIDGMYCFCDDSLIRDDSSVDSLKKPRKNVSFNLFIIQTKYKDSFKESAIEKFISFSRDIFDLSNELEDLKNCIRLCPYNAVN